MTQPNLRLCLVLHNHQPIGNFDDVFEAAYQDSYLPFLDVFEPYEQLSISLHTSGPLADWLVSRHPEYISRISDLVSQGRIEVIGGAYYEPILTMIPSRDRRAQIENYSQWLTGNIGGQIGGMWMPERVWESELTTDLAQCGIRYTVLDDFHFRRAGISQQELHGYFVTENEGHTLCVFPGSEKLRYLIPFQDPSQTIDYCRQLANTCPGSVVVFGDDGEKFGTWPETKSHVYELGWLKSFFDALVANRQWLHTTTLAQAVADTPPRGKVYLPDASYREMTEWALPYESQLDYDDLAHSFENDERWKRIQKYVAGGFWRNFKVRYPEANEMYSRMMYVSKKVEGLEKNVAGYQIEKARDLLFQGQCNCAYWHGAFGGIYLPHLRNAVYQHLIRADNLLDLELHAQGPWIDCQSQDFNFDGRPEIRLANDQLVAWISPAQGGYLYELDVREIGHNLLATMQRRPEAYHEKVRRGQHAGDDGAASIHDRVVFKQAGLQDCLHYDRHLRKSLVDHFWDKDISLEALANSQAEDRGDFVDSQYEATIRRNPNRMQVMMQRTGEVFGQPLSLSKGVTLNSGSNELEIAYMIEGIPADFECHFGIEMNFAGMPDGQDDRYFRDAMHILGQLGTMLDLPSKKELHLVDRWLGLEASLHFDKATSIWTFPIQTVSQSESGFELVHQSVVVQPHWIVRPDANGRWVTTMKLRARTDANVFDSVNGGQALASESV